MVGNFLPTMSLKRMSLFLNNPPISLCSPYKEIEKEMGRDPIRQSKKLQAITEAKEPNPLKRALQLVFLLLSMFLLSCYHASLHSTNLSSTTSTLLNNLDHFIDRKAIFLFFNAILLFLLKDSGLLSHGSSPVNKTFDDILEKKGDHPRPKAETMKTQADVSKAAVESGKSLELVMIEGRGDEDGMVAIERKAHAVEKSMEKSGKLLGLAVIEGEEEKERLSVDEMKDVGIDELNRRFEEFIERVKRERRVEAQQLVMV